MEKLKLFGDNVLIRVETKKTNIILANNQKQGLSIESIIVVDVGNTAVNNCPGLKPGDKIILGVNPLVRYEPYNEFIKAKEITSDENNNVFYYFIKSFEILSLIK